MPAALATSTPTRSMPLRPLIRAYRFRFNWTGRHLPHVVGKDHVREEHHRSRDGPAAPVRSRRIDRCNERVAVRPGDPLHGAGDREHDHVDRHAQEREPKVHTDQQDVRPFAGCQRQQPVDAAPRDERDEAVHRQVRVADREIREMPGSLAGPAERFRTVPCTSSRRNSTGCRRRRTAARTNAGPSPNGLAS